LISWAPTRNFQWHRHINTDYCNINSVSMYILASNCTAKGQLLNDHDRNVSPRDIILAYMDRNVANKKQPLPYVLQIIISIPTRNIIELPPVYQELFPSIMTCKTFFSMSSAFTHSCFHFRYVSFVRSSLKILLALFAKPPETSGYV